MKNNGQQTELLHLNNQHGIPDKDEVIVEQVRKINPDLIAFTSTSFEYQRSNAIAGLLKRELVNPPPIIIGGVHASIRPSDYYQSNFDAFCIGEGEKLLLSIASGEIKPQGLLYGETIESLDSLPQRDWRIVDTEKILAFKKGWLNLGISRGCPFSCTFCAAPLLRKINKRRRPRRMSISSIMTELNYLAENYPVKVFNFDDDLFTSSRSWGLEFSQAYKEKIWQKYRIPYAIESRVDTVTGELLLALKESGCQEIQFGVETGSPELLKFVKKHITIEQIQQAFFLSDQFDINTYAYIILGIPGESSQTIKQTFKLLAKTKPRLVRPTFLCPVYGTELYEFCQQHNLLKEEGVAAWNFQYPLKIKTMTEEELMKYWYLFPWYVNAEMGIDVYRKAVEKFDLDTFRNINSNFSQVQDILDLDKELDSWCSSLKHYRYQPEVSDEKELNLRFNRFELV